MNTASNLQKIFRRPIGVFTDVFAGTERERANAIAAHGFTCVQWRLPLATQDLSAANVRSLLKPYQDNGLQIVALAGYENIVEPNPRLKLQNMERLKRLMDIAPVCSRATVGVATETGTRNRLNPWEWHADNASPAAWMEMKASITELARHAKQTGSRLLLEGYVLNVLRTADDIVRLRRELQSVEFGFVMDPFNLITEDKLGVQPHEIARIFGAMGRRAVIAHAKDLVYEHGRVLTPRAGTGIFDYKAYLRNLDEYLPGVPLILEHVTAEYVADSLAYLVRVKEEINAQ